MTAPINKPLSIEQLECFKAYYKAKDSNWGVLRDVLDNQNVKDKHVQGCLDEARKQDDIEGYVLGVILMSSSKSQRIKLARMAAQWRDETLGPLSTV